MMDIEFYVFIAFLAFLGIIEVAILLALTINDSYYESGDFKEESEKNEH